MCELQRCAEFFILAQECIREECVPSSRRGELVVQFEVRGKEVGDPFRTRGRIVDLRVVCSGRPCNDDALAREFNKTSVDAYQAKTKLLVISSHTCRDTKKC